MRIGIRRASARSASMAAIFLLMLGAFASRAHAQDVQMYVVTHVDILGTKDEGSKLLAEYAASSREDPGNMRMEVVQQLGRPNHFTIIEVWKSQEALDAHEAAAHTKRFREQLQPLLGSPVDERLHHLFN